MVRSTVGAVEAAGGEVDAVRVTALCTVLEKLNLLIRGELEATFAEGHEWELGSLHATYEAFARLKEAIGKQRAFLCGVLSLPSKAAAELVSQRARADLVVALNEQQLHRAFVRRHAPRTVVQLIESGLEYQSTRLCKIHKSLDRSLDYVSLWGADIEALFADYTAHIDNMNELHELLGDQIRNTMAKDELDDLENAEIVSRAMALVTRPEGAKQGTQWVAEREEAMANLVQIDAEVLKRALLRVVDRAGTDEVSSLLGSVRGAHDASPPPRFSPPRAGGWLSACLCPRARDYSASEQPQPSSIITTSDKPMPPVAKEQFEDDSFRNKFGVGLYELQFKERIGSGAAGTTYAAEYKGKKVAVKVAGSNEISLEGWEAEVVVLGYLGHPNVVNFLGAVMEPPTHCLVMEFCEGGDLRMALRRPTPKGFFLRMARGIASGMAYLHSKSILHRDLKSGNVLLSAKGEPKIADLGLSVALRTEDDETIVRAKALTSEIGTYRWMAPEVLRHEFYTTSADTFSYAMVIFEVLTHQLPHSDRPALQAALSNATGKGERPRLPEGIPPSVKALIEACWHQTPHLRPSFAEIVGKVDAIAAGLTDSEQAWLDAPLGHWVYTADEIEAGRKKTASAEKSKALT